MSDWILLAVGLALVLALVLACLRWINVLFWRLLLLPYYRLRIAGREHVPRTGPVLLIANHVTWIDGFLLTVAAPRLVRFLINADYVNRFALGRFFARRLGLIPVPATGPRAQRAAIEAARAALDRGECVGIFPEAQLSRNGLTGTFHRGLELILSGRESVAVVPVFLDNLWGSLFSFSDGRFFSKRPRGWQRRVGIAFGPPIPPPVTTFTARQGVLDAGVSAFALRTPQDAGQLPEPLDLALPRLELPEIGPITASSPNFDKDGIRQTGTKPGSVGHPLPGVAVRTVDDAGTVLGADAEGHVQVRTAAKPQWTSICRRGRIDRDGFLTLTESD